MYVCMYACMYETYPGVQYRGQNVTECTLRPSGPTHHEYCTRPNAIAAPSVTGQCQQQKIYQANKLCTESIMTV